VQPISADRPAPLNRARPNRLTSILNALSAVRMPRTLSSSPLIVSATRLTTLSVSSLSRFNTLYTVSTRSRAGASLFL
jgi:hypothetical protein